MTDSKKRIEELRDEIRKHDILYYVEARTEISDRAYDALMQELKDIEAANPQLVSDDSPTQRVSGEPLDKFRTVAHAKPMLSIDNTYTRDELLKFDERIRKALGSRAYSYLVDPKIDGVAISLRYENRMLVRATTRGDGTHGDDVTSNARTIKSIPLNLGRHNAPDVLEIRGEIYWPRTAFTEFNRKRVANGEEPMANPRNGTAGTLKQLDPRVVSARGLAFIAHGFGEMSEFPGTSPTTAEDLTELLRVCGVPVDKHRKICPNIDAVCKTIDQWSGTRAEVDYDTDGMVVKINELQLRAKLGATNKYPRWCIAYKYETDCGETILRDVSFQVGRTGVITPVAHFDSIPLGGTMVSNASLHNFDEITRLDVRIGDTIVVEKAGEIIPKVIRVETDKRPAGTTPIAPPENCPSCKHHLAWREVPKGAVAFRCKNSDCELHLKRRLAQKIPQQCRTHPTQQNPEGQGCDEPVEAIDHMPDLLCTNAECSARICASIEYFAGRNQMNIDALGPSIVKILVKQGGITNPAELYELDLFNTASLFGKKINTREKIIKGLNKSKANGLAAVLRSLGITGFGTQQASVITETFNSIDELMSASVKDIQRALQNRQKGTEFKFAQETIDTLANNTNISNKIISQDTNAWLLEHIKKLSETRRLQICLSFPTVKELSIASLDNIALSMSEELIVARNIYDYFHSSYGKKIIKKLRKNGVLLEAISQITGQKLQGKKIVVTGTLDSMGRKEIEEQIIRAGGLWATVITSDVSLLVIGNNPGKTKLDKAQKFNISHITEKEFLTIIDIPYSPKPQPIKKENKKVRKTGEKKPEPPLLPFG
ncbi:MAG: NAD-dependent DNA ligase LigA [Phycisphaerae bacterium]|nr:NAD-dependent DNA ligase LigA [Phycisphaerae bacterium]